MKLNRIRSWEIGDAIKFIHNSDLFLLKTNKINNIPDISIINGNIIDIMNETECQVYLKMCLGSEDFENAELIKKYL